MLSFNLEGLKRNHHYLTDLLCNSSPSVIFLQETWLPFSDQNLINNFHPDYTFTISSSDMFQHPEDKMSIPGHVWHGVAIGWRKQLSSYIQPLESTHERIVGVRMVAPHY